MEEDAMEKVIQGRQETLEDLVGKFVVLSREDDSGHFYKNGYGEGEHFKVVQELQNGSVDIQSSNHALAETSGDELPTQELDEGTAIPSSIYRMLSGESQGVTPKVGNFVDSDASDLSSEDDISDFETQEEDNKINSGLTIEKSTNRSQESAGLADTKDTMIQKENVWQNLSDISRDELLELDQSLHEKNDAKFNVLVLNQINEDDPLPGQVIDNEGDETIAEHVCVNVTNLDIHTTVKNEKAAERYEISHTASQEISEDIVENFELDKNFDYDNVELTPKDWNIQFDTVCI